MLYSPLSPITAMVEIATKCVAIKSLAVNLSLESETKRSTWDNRYK